MSSRTNKIPVIQGRASWQLTMTTVAIMATAAWLSHSPLAPALGFTTCATTLVFPPFSREIGTYIGSA